MSQAENEAIQPAGEAALEQMEKARSHSFAAVFETAPVTFWLVVANIIVFIMMCTLGYLENGDPQALILPDEDLLIFFGADFGPLTLAGQPWRLITNAFVHIGLFHLGINMAVLWALGSDIERHLGSANYALVYLASALGGSLLSTYWDPSLASAGASGAIFGIFGVAFTSRLEGQRITRVGVRNRIIFLVMFAGASIASSFIMKGIDNAAHFGGIMTGLLAGAIMPPIHHNRPDEHRIQWQPLIRLAILCLLAVPAYIGISMRYSNDPRLETYMLYKDAVTAMRVKRSDDEVVRQERFEKARKLLTRALKLNPDDERSKRLYARVLLDSHQYRQAKQELGQLLKEDPDDEEALAAHSMALHHLGEYDEAIKELDRLIEKRPDPTYLNNEAWTMAAAGKIDQGLERVNRALDQKPKLAFALDTRGVLLYLKGDYKKATDDFDTAIMEDPDRLSYFFHRAAVMEAVGHPDEAQEDIEHAAQKDIDIEDWEKKTFAPIYERWKAERERQQQSHQ